MSEKTNIEWCDSTWNPLRGCSRVSEGCRNCYAEKMAYRFSGPGQQYEGLAVLKNGHASWTGDVRLVEEHLLDPLKWKKPQRIFVNSMSDVFHESVPDEWIDRIFAVMALCPQHIFQVLTKRPDRMLRYFDDAYDRAMQVGVAAGNMLDGSWVWGPGKKYRKAIERIVGLSLGLEEDGETQAASDLLPLRNVWMGVSVEDQKTADERIPLLLQIPAALRFVSCEPLLGPLQLRVRETDPDDPALGWSSDALFPWDMWCSDDGVSSDGPLHPRIDWVICGGESGPGARPMHPDWARGLRDQCVAAGVPFFFKQWGAWYPSHICWGVVSQSEAGIVKPSDRRLKAYDAFPQREALAVQEWWRLHRASKKSFRPELDGREWKQFPEAQQ